MRITHIGLSFRQSDVLLKQDNKRSKIHQIKFGQGCRCYQICSSSTLFLISTDQFNKTNLS